MFKCCALSRYTVHLVYKSVHLTAILILQYYLIYLDLNLIFPLSWIFLRKQLEAFQLALENMSFKPLDVCLI